MEIMVKLDRVNRADHAEKLMKSKGSDTEMIEPGRYRHFKGKEYELVGVARHSETLEEMVVYRALYEDGGLWVRPASMWEEHIERDGYSGPRFKRVETAE